MFKKSCPLCEGAGKISQRVGNGPGQIRSCLACDGTGFSDLSLNLADFKDRKRWGLVARWEESQKMRDRF